MEMATALVGTLPTLAPRPTGATIRALEQDLVKKLGSIPSHQSREHGYIGMILQPVLYARRTNTPWADFVDPGPHRAIDPAMNTAGQADLLVDYNYRKGVYDSEQNVKAAIIMGLNKAVPPEYRRIPNAVGTREFRITDSPLDILNQIRNVYGPLSPTERMQMENKWAEIWNPQVPIESYYKQLEDIFEQALANPPEYTEGQMIGKAITSIEQCGLFPTALLEWNGFTPPNKDWTNLKAHFGEAYQLYITSGPAGRKLLSGIIGNTVGLTDQGGDDDDITMITNALGEVTMSNNTAAQVMREEMSNLNREVAAMRAAFAASAQGTVVSGVTAPTGIAGYSQPPPVPPSVSYPATQMPPNQAAYAVMPPTPYAPNPPQPQIPLPAPPVQYGHGPPVVAPAYIPPPTSVPMQGTPQQPQGHYQPYQGRGWGGRGRGGRNVGRGTRSRKNRLAYASQPPVQQIPQGYGVQQVQGWQQGQGGRGNTTQKTYRKFYNNWNMCYSCGFDVPHWHTSKTCPQECRRAGHQENCDRGNYKSYVQAGHGVRLKKEDAHILPTNPGPHQA